MASTPSLPPASAAGGARSSDRLGTRAAGRPGPSTTVRPVSARNPTVLVTLRWKLRGSSATPHTASYTRRSSETVNSGGAERGGQRRVLELGPCPLDAVGRIARWSNARSPVERVGHGHPAGRRGVAPGVRLGQVGGERQVGDGDRPHRASPSARRTSRAARGTRGQRSFCGRAAVRSPTCRGGTTPRRRRSARSARRSPASGGAATSSGRTCTASGSSPAMSSWSSGRTGSSPTWPSTSARRSSSGSTPSRVATPACWSRTGRGRPPTCCGPSSGGLPAVQSRAMVTATLDDGQSLDALNEVFVGHPSHQSARYRIGAAGVVESQSSSGLIAATGTGATGWAASIHRERRAGRRAPRGRRPRARLVRARGVAVAVDRDLVDAGRLLDGEALTVVVESDALVVFGDGLEADRLTATWGQTITLALAGRTLQLRLSGGGCRRPAGGCATCSSPTSRRPRPRWPPRGRGWPSARCWSTCCDAPRRRTSASCRGTSAGSCGSGGPAWAGGR